MLLCRGGDSYRTDNVTIEIRAKFANLYVAFATIPSHESFRNENGTVYIQTFCDTLDDKALTNERPVYELLNEVSKQLSKIVIHGHKSQTTDFRTIGPTTHYWYLPIRNTWPQGVDMVLTPPLPP
jgi:hypothetical protein